MKRLFPSFFFAKSTFFAAIVFSTSFVIFAAESRRPNFGYPIDPPIDPCPREVSEFRSFFAFEFDDALDFDNWTAGPNVELSTGNGVLRAVANQFDPYFFSPDLDKLVCDASGSFQTLCGTTLVKLRLKTSITGKGQLFSAEVDEPDYSEERSVRFRLISDGEFHDYLVPIETSSPLLRLRLDPGDVDGAAELDRFELIRVVDKPVKFGPFEIANGKLRFKLVGRDAAKSTRLDLQYFGADPTQSVSNATVDVANAAEIELAFPKKKSFEELEVVATVPETGVRFSRRFFAFHEDVADVAPRRESAPTLKNENVEIRFAEDASGAEIFRDGKRVAILCPLLCEDADGSKIVPTRLDPNDESQTSDAKELSRRLRPVFRSLDKFETEIEFNLCDLPRGAAPATSAADRAVSPSSIVGALRLRLDGDVLSFEIDAPRPVHSPVVRVLGTMKQAQLSGVEYLEEGERSSSSADLAERDRLRFAPPPLWLTAPFASVVSDRGSLALLYDDPNSQAIFAVPDFLDGDAKSCRFNVCAPRSIGKIRIASPEPLEETILWSIREHGLPDVPQRPRTSAEEDVLNLAAFERSKLKMEGGWAHAVGDGLPPFPFDPHYGSDFLSTIWELSGELPQTPRFDVGGGHIRNYASFLIADQADLLLRWLDGEAAEIRARQQSDGSFRYNGEFLRGHWVDYASGDCANNLFRLFEHWRLTGNKDSLNSGIKGLAFVNELKTPRGAQVWELSLHTPDIMGASRCVLSNVLAFEATGDAKYVDAARRWALTGIPFVYRWEKKPLAGNPSPIMLYATTPVFGATGWIAPNWIGLPVQWCGLDYAYSLFLLSKHDSTTDWRKIAEGILVSAELQQYPEGEFVGLLPDSFNLEGQLRVPYNINPCAIHFLRRTFDGVPTSVSVVDVDGRRVVSPFPSRVENGVLRIAAKSGVRYQIVVDGQEIRTIDSQGDDVVSFDAESADKP